MFKYLNTDLYPQINDQVRFVNESDVLIVEEVIDSPEIQAKGGLVKEDMGVVLKGGVWVFTRIDDDGDIKFISRGTN